MNTALSTSVYWGLFLVQLLAVTCNTYLDLHYGHFGTEVICWAVVFAFTLFIGKQQNAGKTWQTIMLIFSIICFLLMFLPIWGLPRAGLYFLAMMQASYNCVTVNRSQIRLSLLISLVLVVFASSHYRSDWSMLFYLLPMLGVLVFTLVAEQVQYRHQELRHICLAQPAHQHQAVVILAASSLILLVGLLFYALTPQINWATLSWDLGQPSLQRPGQGESKDTSNASGSSAGGQSSATASQAEGRNQWPSVAEMRATAKRAYMPKWQAAAINGLADAGEALETVMVPLADVFKALQQWLQQHGSALLFWLIFAALLITVIGYWALLREIPWIIWLTVHWDYGYLVVMSGQRYFPVVRYYQAVERLLSLHELPRESHQTVRVYLRRAGRFHRILSTTFAELTTLFEKARYDQVALNSEELTRVRKLYIHLYRQLMLSQLQ